MDLNLKEQTEILADLMLHMFQYKKMIASLNRESIYSQPSGIEKNRNK